MEFSRQEYWSGLPFSSPGDLLDPGTESWSPKLQTDSLLSEPPGKPMVPLLLLKHTVWAPAPAPTVLSTWRALLGICFTQVSNATISPKPTLIPSLKLVALSYCHEGFCCCSVAQLCLTLCNPMNCSTLGFLDGYYQK